MGRRKEEREWGGVWGDEEGREGGEQEKGRERERERVNRRKRRRNSCICVWVRTCSVGEAIFCTYTEARKKENNWHITMCSPISIKKILAILVA